MNIWIWFRSGDTMEIKDVEYYDAKTMDSFVRIKRNGSGTLICIQESEIRMIGKTEDIFPDGWEGPQGYT